MNKINVYCFCLHIGVVRYIWIHVIIVNRVILHSRVFKKTDSKLNYIVYSNEFKLEQ